mmetsp:Transcript_31414/g.83615  ORF Transcript_31414/g.83615 Transcript_31414/m.83615 type:complete len:102 (+) Transcript_31414:297-602(+)
MDAQRDSAGSLQDKSFRADRIVKHIPWPLKLPPIRQDAPKGTRARHNEPFIRTVPVKPVPADETTHTVSSLKIRQTDGASGVALMNGRLKHVEKGCVHEAL